MTISEMAVHAEPPSERSWFTEYMDGLRWSRLRDLEAYSGQRYRYLADKVTKFTIGVSQALFWLVFGFGVAVVGYNVGSWFLP